MNDIHTEFETLSGLEFLRKMIREWHSSPMSAELNMRLIDVAGWTVDVRTRSNEAIACVEGALLARNVPARRLTLGTDNGSQFTARDFRKHLSARGVTHRRGGYRDPESQAFIESWFGQFKKRCAWRSATCSTACATRPACSASGRSANTGA